MKEIIEQIVAKANVTPEQAKGSVGAVLEFLKGKLPGPIVSQVEKYLGGAAEEGAEGEEAGGNPLDSVTKMFGGDK